MSTPLSRFFGRADETRAVRALLDGARLVTVVGPPGSGKTRLGTEVGVELRSGFRDGACFVDLTSVGDAASVPSAVAAALGVAQRPGYTVTEAVVEALATAELLVILDNCEHLVEAAATMTGALLSGCAEVRLLATSRLALGVGGEQLFPLPPLDLEPSVALFADRARLVRPTVSFDGDDQRHIERICLRMDGLPLAIELAAAWIRVLSPAQLRHRLDTVLPMLISTEDPVSRQGTMEATVGWSYRLLTPARQFLFDQLSVFVGGFDLAAAEAVTNRGVLDDLAALVDHSLVLAEDSGASMRYRLLEPVRQYGVTALAERGEGDTRARHAEHYLALAKRGDVGLRRADVTRHLLELRAEEGNLLAAMAWARDNDPETALRIATALAYFWERRGAVNDGRAWLAELLDATADERLRAAALAGLGRFAWRQRDNDAARACYAENLAIMRRLGDPLGIARALRGLALTECAAGDTATAADLCEQSLRLLAGQGDDTGSGWTLTVLALVKFADGDWAGAERCARQALDASRDQRSVALAATAHLGVAYAAANTGDTATYRGQLTAVLVDLRDALPVVDDPDWLWAASGLAANEGRTRAALRLAGAARAVHDRGSRMPDTLMIFSEEAVDRARREVGDRAAARFMAQGAAMTTEQLMAEALERPADTDRPLSTREREVAGLVGDGLTNEQIATRLFLSRRTVESHVERIKSKLELGGRNEIIAWVIGRRLEEDPGVYGYPRRR
ncbi:tetratricopeptide repeat protein [Amycolatopsis sp. YIM 10]|uniref:ATP-binding protein n=1 Tax=Amycolatopsis sp. YIM 10 TaxID=2653857 RepID=UPI0018843341|nr:tetratricopeptide repeat protein [Amycolatopsis sp. YIM 10]